MIKETTLQQVIRWTNSTDLRQISIYILAEWMDDLLPFEKQIIKEAFTDGRIEAFKNPDERSYITAENYYNVKYGKFGK